MSCNTETDFSSLQPKSVCATLTAGQSSISLFPPDGYSASKFASAIVTRLSGVESVDVDFVETFTDRVIVYVDNAPTAAGSHQVCAWFDATISVASEAKCAQRKKSCKNIPAGQTNIDIFPPDGYAVGNLSNVIPIRISGTEVVRVTSVSIGSDRVTVTVDVAPTSAGTHQICAWFEPTDATATTEENEFTRKIDGQTLEFGTINDLLDGAIYTAPANQDLKILQFMMPPNSTVTINGLPTPAHTNLQPTYRYVAYRSDANTWTILDDTP